MDRNLGEYQHRELTAGRWQTDDTGTAACKHRK